MILTIEKMKAKNWNSVFRTYIEGISSGNADFEIALPSWETWISEKVPECSIVACKMI